MNNRFARYEDFPIISIVFLSYFVYLASQVIVTELLCLSRINQSADKTRTHDCGKWDGRATQPRGKMLSRDEVNLFLESFFLTGGVG